MTSHFKCFCGPRNTEQRATRCPRVTGCAGLAQTSNVTVCVYGRYARAHERLCLLHYGGDRPQAAHRNDATRHQPEVIPVLHVQSGACPLYQREYPLLSSTDENSSELDSVGRVPCARASLQALFKSLISVIASVPFRWSPLVN